MNWHIMLYCALWAYRTTVNIATGFSPYQLVYGVESILPVECEIPSLKLAIEFFPNTSKLEECLVHLEHLNEHRQDVVVALEINKCHAKPQMISLSVLVTLMKVTWSSCMIKLVNR